MALQRNPIGRGDDLIRQGVDEQARKIIRPAYDCEKPPPPEPRKADRHTASPLVGVGALCKDRPVNPPALRRRKPTNRITGRKRARIWLRDRGNKNPTREQIEEAKIVLGLKKQK